MTEDFQIAPEAELREPEKKGFWNKLKRGLFMTHTELLERIDAAVEGRDTIDDETLEYIEESLIGADLGVETSLELVERLKLEVKRGEAGDIVRLRERLVDEISILLLDAPPPPPRSDGTARHPGRRRQRCRQDDVDREARQAPRRAGSPRAAGRGRHSFARRRSSSSRSGGSASVSRSSSSRRGPDPAAVVYDAVQAAKARHVDELIVDTAGRLHNKEHLMRELGKIGRVVDREAEGWTRQTLLVLDATTGQNALSQAREFTSVVDVDAVMLAKIDGTAKGGMAGGGRARPAVAGRLSRGGRAARRSRRVPAARSSRGRWSGDGRARRATARGGAEPCGPRRRSGVAESARRCGDRAATARSSARIPPPGRRTARRGSRRFATPEPRRAARRST